MLMGTGDDSLNVHEFIDGVAFLDGGRGTDEIVFRGQVDENGFGIRRFEEEDVDRNVGLL